MGGLNAYQNMGPKALVEFKAGKMNYDGKMVTPDRRKGLLRVVEDAGGMKQFQWCDVDTKTPIESFYIFPEDAKFEKVKQSKDRVYLLEMKHTQQRYFYWVQVSQFIHINNPCRRMKKKRMLSSPRKFIMLSIILQKLRSQQLIPKWLPQLVHQ